MARGSSGESVLTRAVRILGLFSAEQQTLTTSQIARRADLPAATAHRLVGELVELGVLERDADRSVRMSVQIWEWASRSSRALDLREAAHAAMEDLQAVVGQHVQIGVLEGTDALYLERISAREAVRNVAQIAGRLPIHATSAGLVLLAHSDREFQEQVLSAPLKRYTSSTVCDPGQLRQLLAEIRRQGFVDAPQMITPGARGLGAPVRNAEHVVAALCLVVPVDEPFRHHVGALLASAQRISRELGAPVPVDMVRTRGAQPGA